ncbi:hypothetical protein [Chryseobacterium indoltheticum]
MKIRSKHCKKIDCQFCGSKSIMNVEELDAGRLMKILMMIDDRWKM